LQKLQNYSEKREKLHQKKTKLRDEIKDETQNEDKMDIKTSNTTYQKDEKKKIETCVKYFINNDEKTKFVTKFAVNDQNEVSMQAIWQQLFTTIRKFLAKDTGKVYIVFRVIESHN